MGRIEGEFEDHFITEAPECRPIYLYIHFQEHLAMGREFREG